MKIKIMSPQHGDQTLELAPLEAAQRIIEEQQAGRANFVKFSDGDVFNLMKKSGILAQLQELKLRKVIEAKEEDVTATVVPNIAGG